MKLKPFHLALSLSLLLVACVPQAQLQPAGLAPATTGTAPSTTAQTTESVSFRFVLPRADGRGFRTQFADLADAAFVSLSLVGDGISGTRTSRRVRISGGEASVTLDGLPIQPGQLRVVTAIAYDSEGEPLDAFVGKGFYTSRKGDTEHTITIDRARWLVGRALEILLLSDAGAASEIDHVQLQANAEAAFGLSDGEFLFDPSLFNPAALATRLETSPLPDASAITGTRVGPGDLLAEVGTFNFGNFGEPLTVRVNDPNSDQQTIATGSSSPQNLVLNVSPGSWTFEILRQDGTVVETRPVEVDANGVVTSGGINIDLSNVVVTPVLESLSTSATSIGSTLTLTGRGFSEANGANTVRFGSTPAVTVTPVSATSLQVTVPPGISGAQVITVEVAGQTSNSANFAVVPVITALTPILGETGVILTGSGFSSASTVQFGAAAATISGTPDNTSMTVVPSEGGYGSQVSVTVGSQTSASLGFYYGEFRVSAYTSGQQAEPVVAMGSSGNFVIAWRGLDPDGVGDQIFAQRYDATGEAQEPEFLVSPSSTCDQGRPSIAMDPDGDFVIAWHCRTGYTGIYAMRFNAAGDPQAPQIQVHMTGNANNKHPAVAMDADGDFVVAWSHEDPSESNQDIYARLFDSEGIPLEDEFKVNTITQYDQDHPAVGMAADGDFVVSWFDPYEVQVHRYSATGTALEPDFPVTQSSTFDPTKIPALAMSSDGSFVIAWQGLGQGDSDSGVFARQYNPQGDAIDSSFRVNTFTTAHQGDPTVAINADGDFVIAWNSFNQDGSSFGIYSQRYNWAGATQGSEFLVNAYTTGAQHGPAVAIDADGDFVTVWNSDGQDGSNNGVYARRFTAAGVPR